MHLDESAHVHEFLPEEVGPRLDSWADTPNAPGPTSSEVRAVRDNLVGSGSVPSQPQEKKPLPSKPAGGTDAGVTLRAAFACFASKPLKMQMFNSGLIKLNQDDAHYPEALAVLLEVVEALPDEVQTAAAAPTSAQSEADRIALSKWDFARCVARCPALTKADPLGYYLWRGEIETLLEDPKWMSLPVDLQCDVLAEGFKSCTAAKLRVREASRQGKALSTPVDILLFLDSHYKTSDRLLEFDALSRFLDLSLHGCKSVQDMYTRFEAVFAPPAPMWVRELPVDVQVHILLHHLASLMPRSIVLDLHSRVLGTKFATWSEARTHFTRCLGALPGHEDIFSSSARKGRAEVGALGHSSSSSSTPKPSTKGTGSGSAASAKSGFEERKARDKTSKAAQAKELARLALPGDVVFARVLSRWVWRPGATVSCPRCGSSAHWAKTCPLGDTSGTVCFLCGAAHRWFDCPDHGPKALPASTSVVRPDHTVLRGAKGPGLAFVPK